MVDVACVSGRCSSHIGRGTHPSRLSLMNAHLSPFISSSTVSPTSIAGAVLTPGSGGGGGAPGSPPSSVMFVGVSAPLVESVGAWDVPGSNPAADVTRGGVARSARSRHCRRRVEDKTFSLGRSRPVSSRS